MGIAFKIDKERIYIAGFIAAVALFPWSIKMTSAALFVMSIAGLLSTNLEEKIQGLKRFPQTIPALLLYLLYVIGLLYSDNIAGGLRSIDQKLTLLIFPLITATSISLTSTIRKKALLVFVLTIAVYIVFHLLHNAYLVLGDAPYMQLNFDPHTMEHFNQFHQNTNPAWMRFSYIAFSNASLGPTYLSMYITFCVLILLNYHPLNKIISALKYFLFILLSISVVLLASRMGIFVYIVLCAFNLVYLFYKKNYSTVKIITLTSSLTAILILLIFVSPVSAFRLIEEPFSTPIELPTNPNNWNSVSLRFLEWKSSIESIRENSLVGTGTGGVLDVLNKQYQKVELGDFGYTHHSHNQYLETYLELGLLGFLVLVLCLVVPLWSAFQKKNRLLFSLIVMIGLTFLSTSMFEKGRGTIFYSMFISLLLFTRNENDKEDEFVQ